jgi:predicted nucleotide-binding protein (sugar kinase/HSP70/actin superfamily)
MSKEEEKLQLLRDILLIDDREIAKAIDTRLNTITETLEKKEKLTKKNRRHSRRKTRGVY